MKYTLRIAAVSIALVLSATAAQAQFFSVAVDIPVQYKFDEIGTADDVSGFKVALNLPFLLGLGFEDYTVTKDNGGAGGVSREVGITLFDVFLDLPANLSNAFL